MVALIMMIVMNTKISPTFSISCFLLRVTKRMKIMRTQPMMPPTAATIIMINIAGSISLTTESITIARANDQIVMLADHLRMHRKRRAVVVAPAIMKDSNTNTLVNNSASLRLIFLSFQDLYSYLISQPYLPRKKVLANTAG